SRFYIPPENIRNNHFVLQGSEARHASVVLRKQIGDTIDLFDGKDTSFTGRIESIKSEEIAGIILTEEKPQSALNVELTLYQALIRSTKWDWLIEKACEVGVSRLVPVKTVRTLVEIAGDAEKTKLERWRRIAMAASKQSGRSKTMMVD